MKNRKIPKSLLIVGLLGLAIGGFTYSYFSDTETSEGNTFLSGAIDLKIDNDSWYYGKEGLVYRNNLSWEPGDLEGELFFDYDDLKPGDWGEDTISVYVHNNPAYVCAGLTLTSNDEVDLTEPEESMGDDLESGELAQELQYALWADDGDNVYETDEALLDTGTLHDLGVNNPQAVTLADSQSNIWGYEGPLPGETTEYIGKFWCYGEMSEKPVKQDLGEETERSPKNAGPGFTCSGKPVTNLSQSDTATLDVTFYAEQARHNSDFTCEEWEEIYRGKQSDVYGSVDFSGYGCQVFGEAWDLTKGDLSLSYTIDLSNIAESGWKLTEVGLKQPGGGCVDPVNAGWLTSLYQDPDGSNPDDSADLDDHHVLTSNWDPNETHYDVNPDGTIAGSPFGSYDSFAFWFDRNGVDQWQADMWQYQDGITYNTGGTYDVEITYHAADDATGTMFVTINGAQQGFGVNGDSEPDTYPAGMSFTGDMSQMKVFVGRGGFTDSVPITNLTATGYR